MTEKEWVCLRDNLENTDVNPKDMKTMHTDRETDYRKINRKEKGEGKGENGIQVQKAERENDK